MAPLIQKVVQQQGSFGQKSIVMQDAAAIYKERAAPSLFLNQGIEPVDWPANSLDLNPMEKIWSLA